MRSLAVPASLLALPMSATAEQAPARVPYDSAALSACLDRTASQRGDLAGCVGSPARQCQESLQTADPPGLVGCVVAEMREWDMLMTAWLEKALQVARQRDGANAGAEPLAPVLQQAQAHWVGYRTEMCRYSLLLDGASDTASLAQANCGLDLTARHALRLHALVGDRP